MVADLAVDGEGEVEHRGALGEEARVAGRGEGVDLVLVQVHLDRGQELGGVLDVGGRFEQLAQSGDLADVLGGQGQVAFLVAPVGGDAVLGDAVHLGGADLDLDLVALGALDHGVQRLVTVALGLGDVVLEPLGTVPPALVEVAERGPTGPGVGHDDPEGQQVVDLLELELLGLHLAVHAVQVLAAAGDRADHAVALELVQQELARARDVGVACGSAGIVAGQQVGVDIGVQVAEAEVFQLALHAGQTQAVCDGREDVERLFADRGRLVRLHVLHGPHVVQAVGQLDQDDPNVLGHGQHHLAEVLGLGLLLAAELELADLGDAFDHVGHFGPEQVVELLVGDQAVLHGVVQQPRGDGIHVHVHLCQDPGHRDGVDQVRLAAPAHLAGVGLAREDVRPHDDVEVGARSVGTDGVEDVVETHGCWKPASASHGHSLSVCTASTLVWLWRVMTGPGSPAAHAFSW